VTNTGKVPGAEVVQAYISLPLSASQGGAVQPPRRLVQFRKVELAPGASQDVELIVDPAASNHPLSVWSEADRRWKIPTGTFNLWIGRSSSPRDLVKAGQFSR
jgi:beta-glucosidase